MSPLDRYIHRMNIAVSNTVSSGQPSAKLEDAWDDLLLALQDAMNPQGTGSIAIVMREELKRLRTVA